MFEFINKLFGKKLEEKRRKKRKFSHQLAFQLIIVSQLSNITLLLLYVTNLLHS